MLMHFPMMLWKFHDDLMHTCGSQQKWAGGCGGRPDTRGAIQKMASSLRCREKQECSLQTPPAGRGLESRFAVPRGAKVELRISRSARGTVKIPRYTIFLRYLFTFCRQFIIFHLMLHRQSNTYDLTSIYRWLCCVNLSIDKKAIILPSPTLSSPTPVTSRAGRRGRTVSSWPAPGVVVTWPRTGPAGRAEGRQSLSAPVWDARERESDLNRYRLNSSGDIPNRTFLDTYLPRLLNYAERPGWNAPVTATKSQTDHWTCAKVSPAVSVAVRHPSIPLLSPNWFFYVCPTP